MRQIIIEENQIQQEIDNLGANLDNVRQEDLIQIEQEIQDLNQ